MSSSIVSCAFQVTPEKNGVNRLRPSICTLSLLLAVTLKPRAAIAHSRALGWPTCRPTASRSASGRLRTGERRMSSFVITSIAPGAVHQSSVLRETVDTSSRINSSSERLDSFIRTGDEASWAGRGATLVATPAKAVATRIG
jgi:hypothetical protein